MFTKPYSNIQVVIFLLMTLSRASWAQDYFYIVQKNTDLRIEACSEDNDTPVRTVLHASTVYVHCSQWEKISEGNNFFLVNRQTGRLLRPETGDNGANLVTRPSTWKGSFSQWSYFNTNDGYGHLNNEYSNMYLYTSLSRAGESILMRPNSWTGDLTRWSFEPANNAFEARIKSATEILLDFSGAAPLKASLNRWQLQTSYDGENWTDMGVTSPGQSNIKTKERDSEKTVYYRARAVRHYDYSLGQCDGAIDETCENKSEWEIAIVYPLSDYALYYGDFNNDGLDNDLYFHKDGSNQSYIYFEEIGGTHSQAQPFTATQNQLANLTIATVNEDYFFADLNNDHRDDIIIRGRTQDDVTLVLQGAGGQNSLVSAEILVEYTGENALMHNLSDREVQFSIAKNASGDAYFEIESDEGMGSITYEVSDKGYPSELSYTEGSRALLDTVLGSTSGAFKVSESGAATFDVPIVVPPGISGVTPSISLSYNSQSGRGMLGYGWSLNSSSSITRCRQTKFKDGSNKPLQLNDEDRFCLDGSRLIVVEGFSYGDLGAIYKTEIDNFHFIKSVGGTLGNPDYFKIIGKDGVQKRYGFTQGAKVVISSQVDETKLPDATFDTEFTEARNATIRWSLSDTTDSAGNSIHFEYEGQISNHRLTEIRYAHDATRVKFNYLFDRPDTEIGYILGNKYVNDAYLSSVSVFNGLSSLPQNPPSENLLKQYNLHYSTPDNTYLFGLSTSNLNLRLDEIEECIDLNSMVCLPPIKLDWKWQDRSISNVSQSAHNFLKYAKGDDRDLLSLYFPDINQDGCNDIVYIWADRRNGNIWLHYLLSNESCSRYEHANFTSGLDGIRVVNTPYDLSVQIVDINADGHPDIAVRDASTSWKLLMATPTPNGDWVLDDSATFNIDLGNEERLGGNLVDLNGDGLIDFEGINNGIYWARFQYRSSNSSISVNNYRFGERENIIDFNEYFDEEPECTSNAPDRETRLFNVANRETPADFNADGTADLLFLERHDCSDIKDYRWNSASFFSNLLDGESLSVMFYSEDGNHKIIRHIAKVRDVHSVMVHDINKDGLPDIFIRTPDSESSNPVKLLINNGIGFEAPIDVVGIDFIRSRMPTIVDYDQDGYSDLLWPDSDRVRNNFFRWNNTLQRFEEPIKRAGDTDRYYFYVDMDSDGLQERVQVLQGRIQNGAKTVSVTRNTASGVDRVIEKISNGMGIYTEIDYENLGHSDHYTSVTESSSSNSDSLACKYAHNLVSENRIGRGETCKNDLSYIPKFYNNTNNPFQLDHEHDEFGPPIFPYGGTAHIVSEVRSLSPSSDDSRNMSAVEYHYKHGRIQAGGRGLLGFASLTTVDKNTKIKTETTYSQIKPFVGMPLDTIQITDNNEILSLSVSLLDENTDSNITGYYQPIIRNNQEYQYAYNSLNEGRGSRLSKLTTEYEQDSYGNTTKVKTSINSISSNETVPFINQSKTVENEFSEEAYISIHNELLSLSQLGRLRKSKSIGYRNYNPTSEKTVKFQYYSHFSTPSYGARQPGLLMAEIILNQQGQPTQEKRFFYDHFGNKVRQEEHGWNGKENVIRSTTTEYDASGRYVEAQYNSLGHRSHTVLERDALTGAVTRLKNSNGSITRFTSDKLGREVMKISEAAPLSFSTTDYIDCSETSIQCPAAAKFATRIKINKGAETIQYFDILGREIRSSIQSFDGRMVNVDSEYNSQGQKFRASEPYFSSDGEKNRKWTTSEFDLLGRITQITSPDNSTSKVEYFNQQKKTINALGIEKTELINAAGDLVKVTDNHENTINYRYDAESNLQEIIATSVEGQQITTEIDYDYLGRKTAMHDPDKGSWFYKYNDFGELIEQTDANGNRSINTYDLLGRVSTRADYKNNNIENFTTWYYDGKTDTSVEELPNALGKTSAIVMSSSQLHRTCEYSAQYCSYNTFDDKGRALESIIKINSDNNDSTPLETFSTKVVYDSSTGRILKELDAMNDKIFDDGVALESGVTRSYNEYGFLEALTDLSSGDLIHRTEQVNERGQAIQTQIGWVTRNRYFDELTGRLELQVAFKGLNPVSIETPSLDTVQHIRYGWDVLDNLSYRHNQSANGIENNNLQESFCYDTLNRLVKTNLNTISTDNCGDYQSGSMLMAQDLVYNGHGNITAKRTGPNELLRSYQYGPQSEGDIAGPHAVTKAGNTTYLYDHNGNMISDSTGRTIQYSSFDKPLRLSKSDHVTEFQYGPGRSRFLRIDSNTEDSSKNKSTVYLGNIERIALNDGTFEWKRRVQGELRTFVTQKVNNRFETIANPDVNLVFKDHLGSVDVITDEYGNVLQSMSFDPFGARRSSTNWSVPNFSMLELSAFDSSKTTRGYTGHEMLDDVGIIHMNGRIYDAELGRFLQADPFIQAATDIQMYNRYSYLRNNPLNATDPSGYFLEKWNVVYHIYKKIGPEAAQVMGVVGSAFCGPAAAVCAAAHGYTYTRAFGGTTGDALKAAAISGISSAAFSEVGKYFSGKSAGNWKTSPTGEGFVKFGGLLLTKAQMVQQIVSHGVIGGVTAQLQGGKFGHGFWSAGVTKSVMGGFNFDYVKRRNFNDIAGRTVIAALVGGTTSTISGGKFKNGAAMAAMGHLLNQERLGAKQAEQKITLLELYMNFEDFHRMSLAFAPWEYSMWLEFASNYEISLFHLTEFRSEVEQIAMLEFEDYYRAGLVEFTAEQMSASIAGLATSLRFYQNRLPSKLYDFYQGNKGINPMLNTVDEILKSNGRPRIFNENLYRDTWGEGFNSSLTQIYQNTN